MIHHLLKLVTGGLTASAGINGAPLLIDSTGIGLNGTMPANPWLKPTGNTLSISLARPPATPNVNLAEVQVRAEVYTVQSGSRTMEPETWLARFAWHAGDPAPLPVTREIAFEIAAPPPTSLWAEAARVNDLSATDQQQLRTLMQKLAGAILSRDLDGISVLLDYKTMDCALANGQDPDRMRQVIRELYTTDMFSEPSLRVEGAGANELEFKLVAGGQAVWVFQGPGKPALVVVSPNKRFGLTVFAAKTAGAWRIVR